MGNELWKKLFKTSALYLFGMVAAKLVSFFLLPLYTNKIPTDMYGTYDLVVAYAAIIIPLAGVNCWQGMLRFTVERESAEERHTVVSHGWAMMGLGMLALTAGYIIFCKYVQFSHQVLIYLYFAVQMIQYFYLYTARGFALNAVYAGSGIVSAVMVAISSLVCVYVLHYTIEALYIAQIASLLAQIVFMENHLHLLGDVDLKAVHRPQLTALYRYCWPESIGTIFNWLLSSVNRLIIVAVLGYTANGIYAISNKFLGILNVFMTAFILSFQEIIFSAGPENIERAGNTMLRKFSQLSGIAVAMILIGTSIVYPLFIAGDYREGYILIPLFYFYFLMSGITWILSSIVAATKKTQIILFEKMIIGIINFVLMALLIRPMGLSSSPVSLFAAETIGIVAFKILLKKIAGCQIQIPVKNILLDVLLVVIASVFFLLNNLWLNIIVLLLAALLVLAAFWEQVRSMGTVILTSLHNIANAAEKE